MSDSNYTYPTVPGRGLMNKLSYEQRIAFIRSKLEGMEPVLESSLNIDQLNNNIESYIGSIEIPVGLVGPLLYHDNHKTEEVYAAVATTEGALVASMNRGAKAISECGGFKSAVLHQRMVRTPMFTFEDLSQALVFEKWITTGFKRIKEVTQGYSNHAKLEQIQPYIIGKIVHLKFIFNTGDASGQNMTTTCTWHACLWIKEQFDAAHKFPILHYVIDGNGASDKKVSSYAMQNGRGVHVISECNLTNAVIEKTLRTNGEDIFRSYNHSMAISRMDGMMGYNINVANAIAGIFAATGQDLACVHESSTAILHMEKTGTGLYLSLSLTNLVIGTVGGGTHLPTQSSVLNLMKCKGNGKINRFAELIAGFALSLEISTLAAIVSGQFARSHQKLGRNKPVNWLLRSELTADYINKYLPLHQAVKTIEFEDELKIDNGILTELTRKVSRKLIGFSSFKATFQDGSSNRMVIKSKPLDTEVYKGLQLMASTISSKLADEIIAHKDHLEYCNSHFKEAEVYEYLHHVQFQHVPAYGGNHSDTKREIFLCMMEYLDQSDMKLMNTENTPGLWVQDGIINAINAINKLHICYLTKPLSDKHLEHVTSTAKYKALPLYRLMNEINREEYRDWELDYLFDQQQEWVIGMTQNEVQKHSPTTLIHNDFNPRNIAVTHRNEIKIYDWELAILDIPQRDVIELLCFVLPENFSKKELSRFLDHHYKIFSAQSGLNISDENWLNDTVTAAKEFLLGRVSFYLAGGVIMDYPFGKRIFCNAHRVIELLEAS